MLPATWLMTAALSVTFA